MKDWSDIAVFLAVMREGSAMAAARVLGTNQTTVSRRVARLEEALGLKLIAPGPRGAQPTEAARRLLSEAAAVEQAVDAFGEKAGDITRRLSGTIRVSAHPAMVRYAAGLVRQFEREHPDTHVILDAEARVVSLEDGEADVAIRQGERLTGDTLVARRLFDHPWAFYASGAYLQRHGTPRSFDDLVGHVMAWDITPMGNLTPVNHARARLPDDVTNLHTHSMPETVGVASAGEALAFLPRAEGDQDPGLQFCFGHPDLFQTTWLVTTEVGHADPLIRGFFAFCARAVPGLLASIPPEWRR